MSDESKPIKAADIVKQPEAVTSLLQEYVMIRDMSMFGGYTNLIAAINIMANYGWETVSMAGDSTTGNMYALCRNTHFKRKNES